MSEQTEFNMAVSDLHRLNFWMASVEDAQSQNLLHDWFSAIMNCYDIVEAYLSDTRIKEYKDTFSNVEKDVLNEIEKGRRNGLMNISSKLHGQMRELYRDIRRDAKKAGLLMRMSEDAGRSLR